MPVLEPGLYTLTLASNPEGLGGETELTNNVSTIDIEIVPIGEPDLTVALDPLSEQTANVFAGQLLHVTLELSNPSDVADFEGAVVAGIFLSTDATLDESDRPIFASAAIDGLDIGESVALEPSIQLPDDIVGGPHFLIAAVNPAQYFAFLRDESPEGEADFANNASQSISIDIDVPKVEDEICVGNPISTNSGRKLETEVDYAGSGALPLRFARFYNSYAGNRKGWTTSYSRHLYVNDLADGTTTVILVLDNAMRYEFEDIDAKGYSDPDVPGLLTRAGSGYAYLDADGTIHEFDSDGKLTSVISLAGLTQTLNYVGSQLTSVQDAFGRTLLIGHNADGELNSVTTPAGAVYRYEYSDTGLLTRVLLPDDTPLDDSDNPSRTYLYESPYLDHGLTGIIDENGTRYSTFEYDASGRAVVSTHQNGTDQNTIVYAENETTVTNPLGHQMTYVFEEIQGTKHLIRVDGHASINCPETTRTRQYDSRGSVVESIDPNGGVTRYTYTHTGLSDDDYLYHVGLVTSVTEAAGSAEERTTTIEWHPDLRLPTVISEPGHTIALS